MTPSLVVQIPYGDYFYQLNGDSTCCAFILADYNTFNNEFFNTIVEAINNGTITTQDISTFLNGPRCSVLSSAGKPPLAEGWPSIGALTLQPRDGPDSEP